MSPPSQSDNLLIERIRAGESDAWNDLIARYEGRLLAFVESRTKHRNVADDLVQDTFIGFLTSLPNYDKRRSLEGYLFSIAAHKLIDFLRREGRRPAFPLASDKSSGSDWEPMGPGRPASSIARSKERQHLEEDALVAALDEQIEHWRRRKQFDRMKCAELLFVRGWSNKQAAEQLGITEQIVANYKFECVAKLRASLQKQGLSQDVFPELYD